MTAPADPLAPLVQLPGVEAAVTSVRSAVDALLRDRTIARRSADVSAESSLRGAWASAVLSGSTAELAEVRSGAAATDPLVQAALRAQAALPSLIDTFGRAPRQVLARLHTVAAADLVDADQLGRPGDGVVADRLDTLAAVLAATSAPAVVVAAVVHAEVLALDAFAPVSGIVARAASRLVLIDRGLDPKSLVVPEVGHLGRRAEYEQALANYRGGGTDAVRRWVLHCADAVVDGARETAAIGQALARG